MTMDPTDNESALIAASRRGVVHNCGDLTVGELANSADPSYSVRGELIRELLIGRHGEIDPRGVRLQAARVTGVLDLELVRTTTSLALRHCFIEHPVHLEDARLPRVDLSGSHVPGVLASGLRVEGNLVMGDGFRADSGDDRGTVQLRGADITGFLRMSGGQVSNDSGPALSAVNIRVGSGIFLRDGFTATGAGEHGAVRLTGAHIYGSLELIEATLVNRSGPAFLADRMHIEGYVHFSRGFIASGMGDAATVRMRSGHITGSLAFTGALLDNGTSGVVVDLQRTTAGAGLFFPRSLICGDKRKNCRDARKVDVEHCAYGSLPSIHWQEWLHLLRRHTTSYRPSPYQALAALQRSSGHEGNARQVLIVQQDDLRARGGIGSPATRALHALWGAVAGYGYRARRLAVILLGALLLAGLLCWWAGHWPTTPGHHAAERTTASGSPPGTACSSIELIGLGIDRGLPLAPAGVRARCDMDTSVPAGQWFTAAIWLLQALIWGLATLAIAGYTSLIRKSG
ncbi:hypothetical protein [Amycolatopsis sp. lyj-90]|uniref:hypothetical protein n=1 Tax=Amycolatopsis sp. lyj-90 TaxID=2789285 RepID=UPI003978CFC8